MNARAAALALGIVSIALLAFSAWRMALRVSAFHEESPRRIFAFQVVETPSFAYAGRPVRLSDDEDEKGVWRLRVAYGDDELKLRVTIPGNRELPGLLPHNEWMRVLRFVPVERERIETVLRRMEAGEVADRLVLVTRTPPPGAPSGWSDVWRKGWVFDFHEFRPEGGFNSFRLKYPQTRRREPAREDELRENTWELQAALHLIPKGFEPSYKPMNDALTSVGWTLPAAATSIMLLIAAVLIGFRPSVRLRWGGRGQSAGGPGVGP